MLHARQDQGSRKVHRLNLNYPVVKASNSLLALYTSSVSHITYLKALSSLNLSTSKIALKEKLISKIDHNSPLIVYTGIYSPPQTPKLIPTSTAHYKV